MLELKKGPQMTFLQLLLMQAKTSTPYWVAIVVGTLLNIINQYDGLLGHTSIDWAKLVLTYFVPFGVSVYSGARGQLQQ